MELGITRSISRVWPIGRRLVLWRAASGYPVLLFIYGVPGERYLIIRIPGGHPDVSGDPWRCCRVCSWIPWAPDMAGRGASILNHIPDRRKIRLPRGIGQWGMGRWGGRLGWWRSASPSGRRPMRRRETHIDFMEGNRSRRAALSPVGFGRIALIVLAGVSSRRLFSMGRRFYPGSPDVRKNIRFAGASKF